MRHQAASVVSLFPVTFVGWNAALLPHISEALKALKAEWNIAVQSVSSQQLRNYLSRQGLEAHHKGTSFACRGEAAIEAARLARAAVEALRRRDGASLKNRTQSFANPFPAGQPIGTS